MGEAGARPEDEGAPRRFLTFHLDERLYALPAEEVAEVIRLPQLARVPQAPKGLLGLANLRGAVLPVASLRGLLGKEATGAAGAARRAIVLEGKAPTALAVDEVDSLVTVQAAQVDTAQAPAGAVEGETLRAAFRLPGDRVANVLDVQALLARAFVARPSVTRSVRLLAVTVAVESDADGGAVRRLITFEVAGQEFGMELEQVVEIIPAPAVITRTLHAESAVLGMASYREGLLPLFSLRGLLGLPASGRELPAKVLVIQLGSGLVGLSVDRMRAILAADPGRIEPPPAALTARIGGEARVQAIYRAEEAGRLVSILAPEKLMRDDVMARLGANRSDKAEAAAPAKDAGETLQVVVFRLGEEEFGLPLSTVEEVAAAPERLARVPKAPRFLEGVVNLRGEVLPVVDQRRRFDMPPLNNSSGRRLIVVRSGKLRAGLIVDSVSGVVRALREAVEPAPDLTGETNRLVEGVINLQDEGRLVLLLDAAELLTRTERGLLDKFQKDSTAS